MTKPIGVEQRSIAGIDFTLITQEDSEILRSCMLFPFDPSEIQVGNLAYEVPHVLEHVVCCGDGSQSAGHYKEYLESEGGYINAYTNMGINGSLAFETTQPDVGIAQITDMVKAVCVPAITVKDVNEQKLIVENELKGYLQNPERQRIAQMGYRQGTRYTTDPLSLDGLGAIDPEGLSRFHKTIVSRDNMRVVLAGRHELLELLAPNIAAICLENTVEGKKVFSASSDLPRLPDYHAAVPEIPTGMTDYFHARVYERHEQGDLDLASFAVASSAFYEFLTEGRSGIHEQSRNRGLSYGVNIGWQHNPRQLRLSVSDTTAVGHVTSQIRLLDESLARVADYSTEDFKSFQRKQAGRDKMYPTNLVSFATSVDGLVAREVDPKIITPQMHNTALIHADPLQVVKAVHAIAEQLKNPTFVRQVAFGDNPFGV